MVGSKLKDVQAEVMLSLEGKRLLVMAGGIHRSRQ